VRILQELTGERSALLDVQAANLARMRQAVLASETCTAVRRHAAHLTPRGIAEIPLMTRDDVAEWGSRPDAPHRITTGGTRLVLRSSGSSGRVRTLLHDGAFNERVEALGARGLCMDGLGGNPFVVNALAPGDLFGGFGFADAVLARRGAAVLPAGTSLPAEHLAELIDDLDVRAVVSLPGFLERLWKQVPDALSSLRTVFYLGERMPPATAARLAEQGVRTRSFAYSTTETGPVGYQCAHLEGTDHHVHEDLVLAEVVDGDGAPLPDGTAGALAVTVLADSGTALVRYLVGDDATLRPSDCPCGSPARIVRIGARDDASANLDGTLVTRSMFDEALRPLGLPPHSAYQVGAASRDGLLEMTLRGAPLAGLAEDAVLAALRTHRTLRKVAGSARFAGLRVDSGTEPRLNSRAKAPFFITEGEQP
jgi:phenylacetate-CoA ligase